MSAEGLSKRHEVKRRTIYDACREGDEARVLDYLSKNGCVTEVDERGMTMLHYVTFAGNTKLVTALLAVASPNNVDLDAVDSDGWTPLHYAADRGNNEIVCLLCDEGANVNAKDGLKRTPLHLAALGGRVETVKLLLLRGAAKNVKNVANMTPKECAKAAGQTECEALF
ncbi:ankyrin repeat protein [Strigomonas culicis]|uniref:Ankyrin repeat protein n=1 Tax=Strigomonas culicis TaxID=28005 RepID=S9WCT0_9TRYP|nr:ankyrin repeat protein [Strigomonas culicis]EPY36941.1 ankyrin repeat protein [Strigomonas culicis]|eukprot:EPY36919.1 ankyrin repeat protein [Strigomonas culicis]